MIDEKKLKKALVCCYKAKTKDDCERSNCPFFEINSCALPGGSDELYRLSLEHLNHKDDEIFRLNKIIEETKSKTFSDAAMLSKIKSLEITLKINGGDE